MYASALLLALLPHVGATEVDDLIKQLDANRFTERRAASQRLSEMGPSVFPELAKAAGSGSREVQERALQILEDSFKQGEASARDAAREALDSVVKDGNSQASRRADLILNPPDESAQQAMQNQLQAQLQAQAMIQLRIQAAQQQRAQGVLPAAPMLPVGGANVRRKIQINNNGEKVTIEIQGQKITVETTETKDGKEVQKKVEANSPEELKKKDAEAYKLYERYAGNNQFQIQLNNIQLNKNQQAVPQALPAANKQRILDALGRSQDQLEKEVQKAKESLQGEELERALEQLKRRQESLEKARQRYAAR